MRRVFQRMFGGVGIFLSRLFSLGIPLWFVILILLGSLFGTRILTRNQVVNEVGGKEEYDEAMRYIEIKNIIDEKYIEQVDRKSMGYSAATAMVSGLGDAWSSFLTDDEYKTYQLSGERLQRRLSDCHGLSRFSCSPWRYCDRYGDHCGRRREGLRLFHR